MAKRRFGPAGPAIFRRFMEAREGEAEAPAPAPRRRRRTPPADGIREYDDAMGHGTVIPLTAPPPDVSTDAPGWLSVQDWLRNRR